LRGGKTLVGKEGGKDSRLRKNDDDKRLIGEGKVLLQMEGRVDAREALDHYLKERRGEGGRKKDHA